MSADRAALIQPGWGCGPERPLAWPSTTSTGGPGMGAIATTAKAGHRRGGLPDPGRGSPLPAVRGDSHSRITIIPSSLMLTQASWANQGRRRDEALQCRAVALSAILQVHKLMYSSMTALRLRRGAGLLAPARARERSVRLRVGITWGLLVSTA